jgi:hypothetical protein
MKILFVDDLVIKTNAILYAQMNVITSKYLKIWVKFSIQMNFVLHKWNLSHM